MNLQGIGKIGEDLTCEFLENKGYKILARNYRKPWGEIDIVSKAPDGTLVFVEVKTLRDYGKEGLKPEDNLSAAKLRKFRKVCESCVASNGELIREKKGWRMDLVCVEVPEGGNLTSDKKYYRIRHYENI